MRHTILIIFAFFIFVWAFPVGADEIREDYSTYIEDIRSGKGNEANMPPGLIKKLEAMGKKKRVEAIPEVTAPQAAPKEEQVVPSPKKARPIAPPTDVLIIHRSPSDKQ